MLRTILVTALFVSLAFPLASAAPTCESVPNMGVWCYEVSTQGGPHASVEEHYALFPYQFSTAAGIWDHHIRVYSRLWPQLPFTEYIVDVNVHTYTDCPVGPPACVYYFPYRYNATVGVAGFVTDL